jgi:hypothetical protein
MPYWPTGFCMFGIVRYEIRTYLRLFCLGADLRKKRLTERLIEFNPLI